MFEDELAKRLEPIRHMFLAQVIFFLFESGLFRTLKNNKDKDVRNLAKELNVSPYRLEGILLYLRNEEFIEFTESGIPLPTPAALKLEEARPWYQLLVGGYGQTLLNLSDLLSDRDVFGNRNTQFVGTGSCGISQFDALPMARSLIAEVSATPRCIVDIGCGDGSYLVDLCENFPGIFGIGLEPDETSISIAKNIVAMNGMSDRIRIERGEFADLASLEGIPDGTVFVIAFVLQEVLEQAGRDTILSVLTGIKCRHSMSSIVVIEVDRADQDIEKMTSQLGLGYYNPYFLIHRLTEQRLESPEFWYDVFEEAGWKVSKTVHPDPSYDSLKLKVGFLLEQG